MTQTVTSSYRSNWLTQVWPYAVSVTSVKELGKLSAEADEIVAMPAAAIATTVASNFFAVIFPPP
ncbi:MAG: hypothetical protein ACM3O6_17160 [Acidobacteriota bacterium]